MKHIYEMVDYTNEETYYNIGLYETIEEAVRDAIEGDNPIGEQEDYMFIEIRRREIGVPNWSGTGKVVVTIEWKQEYKEESEEWIWTKPEVKYMEGSKE